MNKLKWILGLLLLVVAAIGYLNYPKLHLISGYAAKSMASNVFIAERAPKAVTGYDHDMPMIKLAESEVSAENKTAKATVFGLMERKAVYKMGLGAVLTNEQYKQHNFFIVPKRTIKKDSLPFPFGNNGIKDTLLPNVNYLKLTTAIKSAFNDTSQKTRSILVVHKNELLAESYADGFNEKTLVLGWSMTKSILATLYGILDYQKKLTLQDRAFTHLRDTANPKFKITLNDLLRMQSGLEWNEDYFKISDVTQMLFLDSDMSLAQQNKKVIAAPGEVWNYSSGTTNLLSGILRDKFDIHQQYLDFPYAALIDKIGMYSMVLETDLAGNYVGSSYAWATTRDWAKLGVLYLGNGNWNGTQLFSKDWVQYVSTPTKHSGGTYGAHFWLNAEGMYTDVPKDLFSLNGFLGQRVFVIPSKQLVIVHTGSSEKTAQQFNTLLKDILEAID